ncbi:hypothetical protein E3E26_04790 [Thermococcus sp. LS1]|nr:hypothetical protein [Thermococcus sp. LS1]
MRASSLYVFLLLMIITLNVVYYVVPASTDRGYSYNFSGFWWWGPMGRHEFYGRGYWNCSSIGWRKVGYYPDDIDVKKTEVFTADDRIVIVKWKWSRKETQTLNLTLKNLREVFYDPWSHAVQLSTSPNVSVFTNGNVTTYVLRSVSEDECAIHEAVQKAVFVGDMPVSLTVIKVGRTKIQNGTMTCLDADYENRIEYTISPQCPSPLYRGGLNNDVIRALFSWIEFIGG